MQLHSAPAGGPDPSDGGTVVVTGAAGFLGSRVVRLLSDAGRYRIIATDVGHSPASEALVRLPGVSFRAMDLRDLDALSAALNGSTHLVHLAAMRSRAAQARPREGFDVNVAATYDLLALAVRHGVGTVVYGSSQTLYGNFADRDRAPFTESEGAVRHGLSLYSAAKLASEAFVEVFSRGGAYRYLCLRLGGIYGPDAAPGSNSGLMVEVLDALDRGGRAAVTWTRDSLHTLIHVDDAARAVVAALELPIADTAVNVVGPSLSSDEIYSTLVRLAGHDPERLDWTGERSRYQRVSGERLRTELGCPPRVDLTAGLQDLVDRHAGRR